MKILIDNGHGIETPGKRSPDGAFREYYWNREVADLVLDRLRCAGYDADLIVTETNDIPLKTRVARVNCVCSALGDSNCILVSIHSNAAGNGSTWFNAQGWSCYTTKGATKADALAECMYDSFEFYFRDRKIRKDLSDGDRDWEENFYILQKTRCPAVLLENFFYDNKEECAWLLTSKAKGRIADAIVSGIELYQKKVWRK